ncbi:MAG: hypothetical protein HYT43_02745 [Candidatus Taylorbacteria bacterium]|nr:hypothetical protein [Candidatus Taylorbacteria bacterium]
MSKNKVFIAAAAIGLLSAIQVYAAAGVSLSPATMEKKIGETFTLTVSINPQGSKIYTAKTIIKYPTDSLEVRSWNFAANWQPLSQPGYDSIDNKSGVVTKTAGYPGGISGATNFGVITFAAKKSGTATVSVDGETIILDAESKNVSAGPYASSVVSITAKPILPPPTSKPKPKTETAPSQKTNRSNVSPVSEVILIATTTPPAVTSSDLDASAAAANVAKSSGFLSLITLGTDNSVIGVLVGLVILAVIWYIIWFATRRRRSQ